ncbi:MAG: hypothetical protein U0556_18640 [Dehalococcoidia bacterium]
MVRLACCTASVNRSSPQTNLAVLVGDVDGQLADLAERGAQFDIVVTCSVLHHLPDYLGFLERAIAGVSTSQILTFPRSASLAIVSIGSAM